MVAFGANLAFGGVSPAATLRQAAAALVEGGMRPVRASRVFRTDAVPEGSGPPFVNGVALFEAPGGAAETLALLHRVEARFGRERRGRWGARTLDLDLLAWGDAVLPDAATEARWRKLGAAAGAAEPPPELVLPHPRLAERAFVLVPFAEVAPDWRHPATGLSVAAMLARLSAATRAAVVPLAASFDLSSREAGPK